VISTCPACRLSVANDAAIVRTPVGWVHSECAAGDGPARTGETITNHLRHYVTIQYGDTRPLRGYLLGPYPDHDTALANVQRGKRLALDHSDARAAFSAYGTASSNAVLRTAFGD
jgi:hypothetical protein